PVGAGVRAGGGGPVALPAAPRGTGRGVVSGRRDAPAGADRGARAVGMVGGGAVRDRAPDLGSSDARGGRAMTDATGRYAYDGLDRVLHEKARLGILISLSTHPEGLTFVELKQLCGLTDGNLSRHLDMLARDKDEDKGPVLPLVEITKGHEGRRPVTRVRLTE